MRLKPNYLTFSTPSFFNSKLYYLSHSKFHQETYPSLENITYLVIIKLFIQLQIANAHFEKTYQIYPMRLASVLCKGFFYFASRLRSTSFSLH